MLFYLYHCWVSTDFKTGYEYIQIYETSYRSIYHSSLLIESYRWPTSENCDSRASNDTKTSIPHKEDTLGGFRLAGNNRTKGVNLFLWFLSSLPDSQFIPAVY